MPMKDKTGPLGTFKNCTPMDAEGNPINTPFFGRGFGRGRGMGRGFKWVNAGIPIQANAQTPNQPIQEKEGRIQALEAELEDIRKELKELKEKEG